MATCAVITLEALVMLNASFSNCYFVKYVLLYYIYNDL